MIHNTETATDSVDTGALAINGPQPVWTTLNEAREQAFTGEIVFEGDPEVLAYLDNGVVYFAERAGDDPLGQRLLDAGVLDAAQLERGLVRLGDLEHLGRLFDRDPSIDRDAVVVTAELFTEELISDVANRMVANARVAAYRHHPSGVHRWFVAPVEQPVVARPIGVIGQLDGAIIDPLPSLPYGLDEDELMIEWDAMVHTESDVEDSPDLDDADIDVDETQLHTDDMPEIVTPEEFDADALELSLELAEFVDATDEPADRPDFELVDIDFEDTATVDADPVDADTVDAETVDADMVDADTVDDEIVEIDVENATDAEAEAETVGADADGDDFEFSVVWPDGSEQPADGVAADLDDSLDVEPAFTETDEGELQFSMPPLALGDEPEVVDAEVPDDVADAVRRAIAAIESASVGEPEVDIDDVAPEFPAVELNQAPVTEPPAAELDDLEIEFDDAEIDFDGAEIDLADDDETLATPEPAPASSFAGFAPPTMATRAEVLYGQMADNGTAIAAPEPVVTPTLAGRTPAMAGSGDDAGGQGGERTSALRRLIGSLRHKDH